MFCARWRSTNAPRIGLSFIHKTASVTAAPRGTGRRIIASDCPSAAVAISIVRCERTVPGLGGDVDGELVQLQLVRVAARCRARRTVRPRLVGRACRARGACPSPPVSGARLD